MFLTLDIETIPTQSYDVQAKIAASVTPSARMSKAETIAAWEANDKPAAVKDAIAKTALDGAYGHVCCVGWAFNDEPAESLSMNAETAEIDVLSEFIMRIGNRARQEKYANPVIVGHNVIGFDIRFLWQRAIILGLTLPIWFPRDPRPWQDDVFDTMTAFAGQRGTIGLDRLCQVLGIPGKDGFDGSMVADAWARGEHERIASYCCDDVERTRAAHRKMQIAFGEAA